MASIQNTDTERDRIYVEINGTFDKREDAARCLENVAQLIRAGHWQASNPVGADPYITITSAD